MEVRYGLGRLVVILFLLVAASFAQNLENITPGYQISPKACQVKGQEGTCMFVWECIKTEGSPLGMCMERFMFGSCCAHPDLDNNVVPKPSRPSMMMMGQSTTTSTTVPTTTTSTTTTTTTTTAAVSSTSTDNSIIMATEIPVTGTGSLLTSLITSSRPPLTTPLEETSTMSSTTTTMSSTSSTTTVAATTSTSPTASSKSPGTPPQLIPIKFRPRPSRRPILIVTRPTVDSLADVTQSTIASSSTSHAPSNSSNSTTLLVAIVTPSTTLMTTVLEDQTTPTTTTTLADQTTPTTTTVPTIPEETTLQGEDTTTLITPTTFAIHENSTTVDGEIHELESTSSHPITAESLVTPLSNSTFNDSTTSTTNVPSTFLTETSSTSPLLESTVSLAPISSTTISSTDAEINTIISSTGKPVISVTWLPSSYPNTECGVPPLVGGRQEGRIVGGSTSKFGSWPWQVSVRRTSFFGFSSTHRCGGALLNELWVVTAGHCVEDLLVSQIRLRMGEYDFSSVQEPYAFVERGVNKKIVHPKYNFFTYEYDLALVRLEEPITFQPNIAPICLPATDETLVGENGTVTGWGRLSEGGTLPSILQQVTVPIVSNDKCKDMFLKAGRNEYIPDIFMCAGFETGGRDSCQGDSGGPLQIRGKDGRYFLAGIISWGIGCAEANLPGVCTRISKFTPWILENVT